MKDILKLALEALEEGDWYINQLEMIVYCVDDDGTHENRVKVQTAVTAIKYFLAQPAQRPWVGLTQEQKDSLLLPFGSYWVIDRIEAMLKEKNA